VLVICQMISEYRQQQTTQSTRCGGTVVGFLAPLSLASMGTICKQSCAGHCGIVCLETCFPCQADSLLQAAAQATASAVTHESVDEPQCN
jgi:hypothetical protein